MSKLPSFKKRLAFEEQRNSPHIIDLSVKEATGLDIKDSRAEDPVIRRVQPASQVAFQLAELSLAVQRLNRVLDRAIDRLSKLNAQR